MASRLLTLYVDGQPRRYTTAATAETVEGEVYQPGLQLGGVEVHGLGSVSVTIDDPAVDWASLLLAMRPPPQWRATLAWADASGAVPLVEGVATIGTVEQETVLPVSVDPSIVPGARMVPDPTQATIAAGDYPSDGHTSPSYTQDESTIGAVYPRVYGAPGLSAMEAGATTGGPTTTAYRVEVGLGALNLRPARIVIASPPTAASAVTIYDVSGGQDETGGYVSDSVSTAVVEDARGRQVQVVTLDNTVNLGPQAGTRYGLSWDVDDAATDRTADYVVADMLTASGRPVDESRMRLGGALLDVSIESPVDPVGWVLEQLGAVPLFIGRSWAGFYAAFVPIDQQAADMSVTLGAADSHTGITPASPASVASRVLVSYAPIDGQMSRQVLLTPDGGEDGSTSHPACTAAHAAGYDGTVEQQLPAVCDPATARRMAELLAVEHGTPGPAVSITVSDPATVRRLVLRGAPMLLRIASDGTDDAPDLTGRYVAVDRMVVSDTALTITGTVRR